MERIENRHNFWEVKREQAERNLARAVLRIEAISIAESGQLELNYEDMGENNG